MANRQYSMKEQQKAVYEVVEKSVIRLFGGKKRFNDDIKAAADEVGLIEGLCKAFKSKRGVYDGAAENLIAQTIHELPQAEQDRQWSFDRLGGPRRVSFQHRTEKKVKDIVLMYQRARRGEE